MTLRKTVEKLSESRMRAIVLWPTDHPYIIRDTGVRGLLLRKGLKRTSWHFYDETRIGHGERSYTSRVLGDASKMTLAQARKQARKIAGRIAADRREPGKREAVRFETAFADYIEHLQKRATDRGKPASWAANVAGLGKLHILPKWCKWSLAEMSASPKAVKEWHKTLTKNAGPTSANHCCRVIRAAYRLAKKENRSLPPHDPTSAVRWNAEKPRQAGLPFGQFAKWAQAWAKIDSPTRKSFALLGILTGCRPGELSRLKWSSVNCRARSITISQTKTGDILIPMSWPIARALRLARDYARREKIESEWVFPARGATGHLVQFAGDRLPAHGHALRHIYKDVALAVGVDDFQQRLLMGHSLRGVSQKYLTQAVISLGTSLRASQAKISRRIVSLLIPTVKAPALAPDMPQDARTALLTAMLTQ
jgi:integrase